MIDFGAHFNPLIEIKTKSPWCGSNPYQQCVCFGGGGVTRNRKNDVYLCKAHFIGLLTAWTFNVMLTYKLENVTEQEEAKFRLLFVLIITINTDHVLLLLYTEYKIFWTNLPSILTVITLSIYLAMKAHCLILLECL